MKQYLVEAVGTFFLTLAIIWTGGDAMAVGLMLMAMIYMSGHISGGHFNPLVTLAVWVRGGSLLGSPIVYMIAQSLGAIASAALFYVAAGVPWRSSLAGGVPVGISIVLELLAAFVFASAVLALITTDRIRGLGHVGLFVGLSLTAVVSFAIVLVNPAVGIASALFALIAGDIPTVVNNLIAQIGVSLLGAVLAAFWFRYLNPSEVNMRTQQY